MASNCQTAYSTCESVTCEDIACDSCTVTGNEISCNGLPTECFAISKIHDMSCSLQQNVSSLYVVSIAGGIFGSKMYATTSAPSTFEYDNTPASDRTTKEIITLTNPLPTTLFITNTYPAQESFNVYFTYVVGSVPPVMQPTIVPAILPSESPTAFATINNPSPSQFPVHLPTPNPTKRPITFPTSWPTAPTAIHPNGYGCSAVYPNCPSHCPYGASNTYQNPLTGCTFYCKSLSSADQCEVGGSGCTSSCRTAGQLAGIIIGSVSGIVLVLTLIVCCCIRSGCCNNPCKKSPPLAFQSELPNVNPLSANQGSNHIVANQQC